MTQNSFIVQSRRILHFFASLKTVIPLLIFTTLVTIITTLIPEPDIDIFQSSWYLGLMGLLGFCLLCTTLERIPVILSNKGSDAVIGIVTTHVGILILIAAFIYGGMIGFRYKLRIIENEMTIVPELPFVIQLDRLVIEEFPEDAFGHLNMEMLPKKRQDSEISLYKNGNLWLEAVVSPGNPLKVEGLTLLPSQTEFGWYFELIVTDPMGREKTIPVRPWAPPLINVGSKKIMAHKLTGSNDQSVQIFIFENETRESPGFVSKNASLEIDGYIISLGEYKRYTGLVVYHRPQMPLLLLGCFTMLAGLVWHFYHTSKTRVREKIGRPVDA